MKKLQTGNLLRDVPRQASGEIFSELASSAGLRVERIVSTGRTTPEGQWYDQEWDEWVLVVRGAARLAFEDGADLDMRPGDHVLIPAHCRHRVAWTTPDEPTVWLAVHYDASTAADSLGMRRG
jgi:cupin 2 domain-containing protein